MTIAFDARTILGPKTGDRTYTLNLMQTLPVVDEENQYLFLFDREPEAHLIPVRANVSSYVRPWPGGKLWTAWGLPLTLARLGVNLLHLQYIAPLVCPCPYVTTVHDLSFLHYPTTFPPKDLLFLRLFVPLSVRQAALVLTGSESTKRDLIRYLNLPAGRVQVTPYGVGREFYPRCGEEQRQVRAKYGLPRTFVLSVGVLQPRKNLERLLAAYCLLRKEGHPPPPLVITGKKGWSFASLFRRAEEWDLRDAVIFTGYVPDEDLPALYSAAQLLAYPSLYEGFGLPVLEAMACGTPVVTSNVSALPEVAGAAAELVVPTQVESIAEGLWRLLASPQRRAELRHLGLQRARAFTWQRTAELTLAAYRQVIGDGQEGRET